MGASPLIVFSHLRWNFVFQRPQHVISRLARRRDVVFVEEPIFEEGEPRLEIIAVAPRVSVAHIHLPIPGPAFGLDQEASIVPLLAEHIARKGWTTFGAWLYTPMAVRIALALGPKEIIYDCMDELSAFLGAPPELLDREQVLLDLAGAVFTGGPSLHRAKRDRHPGVYCFPSSVEVEHFANPSMPEPREQSLLNRPRLGFFGVIDERIDLAILAQLARSHPEWQIMMIGPIARIGPGSLPRSANLHYLGQRRYTELPAYLAGWNVCLIPYVIGPATRFINPTNALEYMAAGRPVVTTPIHDVVEPYGDIVFAASGPEGFVAACERAMRSSESDLAPRNYRAQRVLQRISWDRTVEAMDLILSKLLDRRSTAALTQHAMFDFDRMIPSPTPSLGEARA